MNNPTCVVCGAHTDWYSIDLCADVCVAHLDEFDAWADANRGAAYATWPALSAA